MATRDRISVQVDAGTREFLEQIGGEGRGAISRGVAAVIEFAQALNVPFLAFTTGRVIIATVVDDDGNVSALYGSDGRAIVECDKND